MSRKNMQIIIEGPDGAGKSTLAKKIADTFNLKIIHSGKDDLNNLAYYAKLLTDNPNAVFDRFYFSEIVYGNALRNGKLRLTQHEINQLQLLLEMRDVIIFYVTNTKEVLTDRMLDCGETYLPAERLDDIMEGYENLFNSGFELPVFKVILNDKGEKQ